MKKVLYVATVLSHICQFHLPYLKLFKDKGYETHVAAKNNLAEKNGLELKNTDKYFDVPFVRSPFSFKNLKAYKSLKKVLTEEKYDVIVCNTPMGGVLTRLAAKKSRKNGTKVIYFAHGFHFYKGSAKKNWMIYYPIEKTLAKRCDLLLTINSEDYSLAKAKFKTNVENMNGVGVDKNRYYTASLEERKTAREKLGYKENDFLILTVGELLPNKNQIQVIKAVEKIVEEFKNVKLLFAGNGRMREELETYVSSHNLQDNVKFIGYCSHLEDYQRAVDLGVSCSIREGLGLNVVEAMMSGNTFVATKNRGHCELIKDGINGFLVDVGDVDTLADRISTLIKDKELRDKMSKTAVESMEPFCLDSTLSDFENILNKY